jgi:hypothetical protein
VALTLGVALVLVLALALGAALAVTTGFGALDGVAQATIPIDAAAPTIQELMRPRPMGYVYVRGGASIWRGSSSAARAYHVY